MSNTTGRQHPLGDRCLNYSVSERGGIDHDSGRSLKMPTTGRTEVCYNPRLPNIEYTPNHHRTSGGRGNAPFKSPITLCFDRMLGAGKFCLQPRYKLIILLKIRTELSFNNCVHLLFFSVNNEYSGSDSNPTST